MPSVMTAYSKSHTAELYKRFLDGGYLSDEDLLLLTEAIERSLPFLAASPSFTLVYLEAKRNLEAMWGFKQARLEAPRMVSHAGG